jgi:hypothetical protein
MSDEAAAQLSAKNAMRLPRRAPWMVWVVTLACLLILLIGRYSWDRDRRAVSMEGYLASAWMLVLLLPAVFYTARRLAGYRAAMGIATAFAVVCALPYRWLGFARMSFWSDIFYYSDWTTDPNAPTPSIAWFPAAFRQGAVIPHEALVFGLLLAAGAATLLWASRGILNRRWFREHPAWGIGAVALVVILLETWLHLSMLAPYSIGQHFAERTPEQKAWIVPSSSGKPEVRIDEFPKPHGWWHVYLFPDYRGAVNRDYGWFRAGEEMFQGVPPDKTSPIMRRALIPYFSSQFVCFFNPYYVCMFINTACWVAAVVAGYGLARRWTDGRTAAIFAMFIATGSGFIYFVNQPMPYLGGYAAEIVLLYLFEILIVGKQGWGNVWLFGLLYGLGLLTTDLLPLAPLFLIYAWARRMSLWRSVASIVIACCVFVSTLAFLAYVARVPYVLGNIDLLTHPTTSLSQMNLDRVYLLCLELFNRFSMDLFHAFLILPIFPALVALGFLREKKLGLIAVALMLPAFLTIAYFEFSGFMFLKWPLAALPRFAYVAYPAIYLLAAMGLVEGGARVFRNYPRIGRSIPWVFLLMVFALNNLDVFGVPATYYDFYFGMNQGGVLPFGEPHQ